MSQLSEEERQKIINSSPIGTWALMLTVSVGMVAAWLFLYYGVFLPRGAIDLGWPYEYRSIEKEMGQCNSDHSRSV